LENEDSRRLQNFNGNILGDPRVARYTAMMLRILFVLLVGLGFARASEPINAPVVGASATVTQPHSTAELIPESTAVQAGQPFDVALHLHSDPGWHTYWVNPGDAGLATRIKWTLPPGFTAGPIQWPTPEKHNMGPLVTYGYGGDVYLLTTITPPKDNLPQHFNIVAKASWLVCEEECVPGKAELTVPMDSGLMNLRLPQENAELFAQARARMPVTGGIVVNGRYEINVDHEDTFLFSFKSDLPIAATALKNLQFFPLQPNVYSTTAAPRITIETPTEFSIQLDRQQNGDAPSNNAFVLVSNAGLVGIAKAVYVTDKSQQVAAAVPSEDAAKPQGNPAVTGPVAGNAPAGAPSGGPDNSLSGSAHSSGTTGGDPRVSATTADSSDGHRPPLQDESGAAAPNTTLIAVLGAAFIGGLILNLMPCVLPVLSLKVFSLMKHAGENAKSAWIQGVAFTAGVVISFWALAGLLLILRTAGNHLGWGFQMQSPGFVLFLILLFFLLALNLFGVFELGASLVGLDARAAGKMHGTASSFGNGTLATVAATPCTAPFMGSALGFAAQQPAYISLLIFTFLAFGMATPYLLLTLFPSALRFVPKPGAWMEAFKQFMGFLLMATVIFLVYVFGALVGEDQVPWLLFVLLLAGLASWIYGKWATPMNSGGVRAFAYILTIGILGCAIFSGIALANYAPKVGIAGYNPPGGGGFDPQTNSRPPLGSWQPWSQSAVDQALAQGQPVFVDFTAAWCLSCKVNERVALGTDEVKKALADKNVALFKADWTHADPAISQTLQKFNRDGVPLYLVYSPKNPTTPQVLPEVLTPGIVLDALGKL
jgi:thiol:disulfide interchange protein/DsbC/DsbD-like thiol-disulfide interchange protein